MHRKFAWLFLAGSLSAVIVLIIVDIQSHRPLPMGASSVAELTPDDIAAAGRCASCHIRDTPSIVRQYMDSRHFANEVTCLSCHAPLVADDPNAIDHRGFRITLDVTAGRCHECHSQQYDQFLRSRHAAPSWAAVRGRDAFTQEQYDFAHRLHPEAMDRGPNALALSEGEAHVGMGCVSCHSVGEPNVDGSVGNCSACHARHEFGLAQARNPMTCGSCHLGPDHSQIEIWTESRHGGVYAGRRDRQILDIGGRQLTALHQDAPTCSTCHMSGIASGAATHNVGERLSYYLFAEISTARDGFLEHRARMQAVCRRCHGPTKVETFYEAADAVLLATNDQIAEGRAIIDGLREEGLLTPEPFDEPIEFLYFDFWHYAGRTAKHGAYMGGADFVQWHGIYEIRLRLAELNERAAELRERHARLPEVPTTPAAP